MLLLIIKFFGSNLKFKISLYLQNMKKELTNENNTNKILHA